MHKLGKAYILGLIAAALLAAIRPAEAIPVFAHRYGVQCAVCHTIVPELTPFGQAFAEAGYRWPAVVPTRPTFPIAMKVNLAYTSAADPGGLPRALVDEVEFLLMGTAGPHLTYRWEQYAVDGGVPGNTRDAYLEYRTDPLAAYHPGRPSLGVQAGSFTLPLPDDPETFRPTESHYAVYDQTVGSNPFTFFSDRIGLNVRYGSAFAGMNVLALQGHDPQSGLPTSGTDTMLAAHVGPDALSLWGYRYLGTRPLGPVPDRFSRTGAGLISRLGKAHTSLVLQTGTDSSLDGAGTSGASSGGYLQEEWLFDDRWLGVVRYDGTSGPGQFQRSTTVSVSFRPYPRARWTLEDVITLQPQTQHTLNAAWLFAY